METFRKPWLAIFGAEDIVVPPEPNIREVIRTTALGGNPDVSVAVLPRSGHASVDSEGALLQALSPWMPTVPAIVSG